MLFGLCVVCGSSCAPRAELINCKSDYMLHKAYNVHTLSLRKSWLTPDQDLGSHFTWRYGSTSELENKAWYV